MDARERQKLVDAIGAEDAAAVERFLGEGCALCLLVETADRAEQDWPEWARAAAVLQRWLEAHGRTADAPRKLGYLTCTHEGYQPVASSLRPPLAQAVARMLEQYGFQADNA
jgi:hypothetical protein